MPSFTSALRLVFFIAAPVAALSLLAGCASTTASTEEPLPAAPDVADTPGAAADTNLGSTDDSAQFTEGEILVCFRREVSTEQAEAAVSSAGYTFSDPSSVTDEALAQGTAFSVTVPAGSEQDAISRLQSTDGVALAQLNYVYTLQ